MEINSLNPKLSQDQIAKKLVCSSSTLQRYRQDTNMLPLIESHQGFKKEVKRFQTIIPIVHMPSEDLKRMKLLKPNQMQALPVNRTINKKSKLRGGRNIENIDNYLDEM